MGAIGTESNIKIEPCNVFWGKRKQFTVLCVADVAGSLNNKYFTISYFDSNYVEKKVAVWYDINTAGVQPTVSGATSYVKVSGATGASAATLADATMDALLLVAGVFASITLSTATLTVTLLQFGPVTAPAIGDSGFTITSVVVGFGGSLGFTTGGVTLNFSKSFVEVKADQFGDQKIDDILNGVSAEVEMTLQETHLLNLRALIGNTWGAEVTPNTGTLTVAAGTAKNFSNMRQYACQLILKPVSAVDDTNSHCFWLAFPDVSSLNFSGTDLQQMPVKFSTYRDNSKVATANIWVYGDHTQDFSA